MDVTSTVPFLEDPESAKVVMAEKCMKDAISSRILPVFHLITVKHLDLV